MPQTRSPVFDQMARLLTGASDLASGTKREIETLFRLQAEQWLGSIDMVRREEFEMIREMILRLASTQDQLDQRLAAIEALVQDRDAAAAPDETGKKAT